MSINCRAAGEDWEEKNTKKTGKGKVISFHQNKVAPSPFQPCTQSLSTFFTLDRTRQTIKHAVVTARTSFSIPEV